MVKVLTRYSKGLRLIIVLIAGLLFVQAQCELALPDYMSDIVTYGIQSRGISDNVPEIIDADSYDKALIFIGEKDKKIVNESYKFVKQSEIKNSALAYEVDSSKCKNGIYVLKDISDSKHDKLSNALGSSFLITYSMDNMVSGKDSTMSNNEDAKKMQEQLKMLPKGSTIYDLFKMMPESEIKKIVDKFDKSISSMGESSKTVASSVAISNMYQKMGINTQKIQTDYILNSGMMMLLIAVGSMIAAITVGYFASMCAAKISMRLRRGVFNQVENFSTNEIDKFSTASLITRSTNDIQQVQFAIVMMLRIVIYSPIMGIGAIIRVVNSSLSMVWIIALVVIIIMCIIAILMMVVGPKFQKMQSLVDRINLVMREALSGLLVIRAFHNEEREEERFETANQNITNTQLFTSRTMALMMPIIMFIMSASSVLIVWVGSYQIDLGNLQIGDMMAYIQYAMQIIMSFMMIAMISVFLPRAGVAAKRCLEVIDTPLSIRDKDDPTDFNDNLKGLVEFKDVSFTYPGADEEVLKNITFTAKPGETTAFIGSTGSGKSTIINLVPRFFDATKGEILVDGINVKDVRQKDLRSKIGLVPQKGILFQGDIESNIKYSDENMNDEKMQQAANIAQASEFIEEKSEGYQSEIAQGGSNVSGGQRQRISIARAIAKDPEIFIFDDSFSALDFKTDALVREGLKKLCSKSNSTMLLVGQRIASIMHAEQIVVLNEGVIVGKGTHEELMKNCDVYQEIALSQLSKEELENE